MTPQSQKAMELAAEELAEKFKDENEVLINEYPFTVVGAAYSTGFLVGAHAYHKHLLEVGGETVTAFYSNGLKRYDANEVDATIAALRESDAANESIARKYLNERDALKAELAEVSPKLRTAFEFGKGEVSEMYQRLLDDFNKLRTENERLRAALKKIADDMDADTHISKRKIAKQALNEAGGE